MQRTFSTSGSTSNSTKTSAELTSRTFASLDALSGRTGLSIGTMLAAGAPSTAPLSASTPIQSAALQALLQETSPPTKTGRILQLLAMPITLPLVHLVLGYCSHQKIPPVPLHAPLCFLSVVHPEHPLSFLVQQQSHVWISSALQREYSTAISLLRLTLTLVTRSTCLLPWESILSPSMARTSPRLN